MQWAVRHRVFSGQECVRESRKDVLPSGGQPGDGGDGGGPVLEPLASARAPARSEPGPVSGPAQPGDRAPDYRRPARRGRLAHGGAPSKRFTQQEPSDGEPATERTEVQLLYDANALYIAVHAYDSDPAGVIATEMRRDSPRMLEEDNFQLILDTFRDSRSGYMFVTNPLGAKLEQQVFEEGGGNARGAASNINRDWNGVWSAASQRTSDGWTAEIMIPMVTLRSPDVESQVWGINFMRNIRRKNEQVYWAPIPKPYGLTQVSMAGTMGGMTSLTRGLDLRVKPFVVAGGRRDRSGDAVVRDPLRDVGLDVKYGLGSGLALDVTLNTDFAQAEVDEQQVNLTRFPLFFPGEARFLSREFRSVHRRQPGHRSVDGSVLQPAHRAVRCRPADPDHRRRPHDRKGGRPQPGRHGYPDRPRVRQAGRQLLRRALQQGSVRPVEGRRAGDQQGDGSEPRTSTG